MVTKGDFVVATSQKVSAPDAVSASQSILAALRRLGMLYRVTHYNPFTAREI
jgi:hypothetical protein